MITNLDLQFLQAVQDLKLAPQDPASNLGPLPVELERIRRLISWNRLRAAYKIDDLIRREFDAAKKRPNNAGVVERLHMSLMIWALTRDALGRKQEAQIAISMVLEWATVPTTTRAYALEIAVAVEACPEGRLKESIQCFRKSGHEIAAFSALLCLAQVFGRQERFAEAEETLNKAQELLPSLGPIRLLTLQLQRIRWALEAGEIDRASAFMDSLPEERVDGFAMPYIYAWKRTAGGVASARGDRPAAFTLHAEAARIATTACGAEMLLQELEAAGDCRPAEVDDDGDEVQMLLGTVAKLQDLGKTAGTQVLRTRPLIKWIRGKGPKHAVDFDTLYSRVQEAQLKALDSRNDGRRQRLPVGFPGSEPTEEIDRPDPAELLREELAPGPSPIAQYWASAGASDNVDRTEEPVSFETEELDFSQVEGPKR